MGSKKENGEKWEREKINKNASITLHELFSVDACSAPALTYTISGSHLIYIYIYEASVHPSYNTIWLPSEWCNETSRYEIDH